jgi:hypothetical protein
MVEYCFLATASYSLCCAANRALGVSPGAVVFHCDMLIDVPYVANLLLLREKRQAVIDDNLRQENNQRRNFDYVAGQQVLELVPDPA